MAESAETEPTMEEILSSIRRIINEDDEAPAEAEGEAEAAAEPAAEVEDLDQAGIDAAFDSLDAEPEPEPDMAEAMDDVFDLTEKVEEEGEALDDDLMIVDREPEPEPEPVEVEEDEGAIMGDAPAAQAAGSFYSLIDEIRISETEGQTLEGVVRALIRPMLKEWLDNNLPGIVEEKVQAEIERVARRRR